MFIRKLTFGAGALALGLYAIGAQAQMSGQRLIVLGEDSDPDAISRTDEIYSRVVTRLQDELSQQGIIVIDEKLLTSELGLEFQNDTNRLDLVKPLKAANQTEDLRVRSRLAFIFSVVPIMQDMSQSRQLRTRLRGEIYDLETMTMVRATEVESLQAKILPLDPGLCNDVCIRDAVGDEARAVAGDLAVKLTEAVAQLQTGATLGTYRLTISDLPRGDALKLTKALSENKDIRSVEILSDENGTRNYAVNAAKGVGWLEETVLLALLELGIPDESIILSVSKEGVAVAIGDKAKAKAPASFELASAAGLTQQEQRNLLALLVDNYGAENITRSQDGEVTKYTLIQKSSELEFELAINKLIVTLFPDGQFIADGTGIWKLTRGAEVKSHATTAAVSPDSRDGARKIQEALSKKGFYNGTIDGLWGPGSRKALALFQKDRKLIVVDGSWSADTETALFDK